MKRWEKERADWLLSHELSWTLSDRRMANKLKRRAAQLDRKEAGAAESSFHEGQIPWVGSRFIAHGEDPKEKAFRFLTLTVLIIPGLALVAGPAMALAKGFYGICWWALPQKGLALRVWPWLVTASVTAVVGFVAVGFEGRWLYGSVYPPSIQIDYSVFWPVYGWLQVNLAMLLTAARVRHGGWPGVKKRGSTKLPTMPTAKEGATAVPVPPKPEPEDDVTTTADVEVVPDDEDAFEDADMPTEEKKTTPGIPTGNYQKEEANHG